MAETQPCPSCGWGSLMELVPTVLAIHRLQVSSDPLTLEEVADYVVRDTLGRPLNDAPEALCLGFATISIRGGGALAIDLSDETECMLLAGIPPDSEEGLALWALLGPTIAPRPVEAPRQVAPTTGAHVCRCPDCVAWIERVKP